MAPFRPESIQELVRRTGMTFEQIGEEAHIDKRNLYHWVNEETQPGIKNLDRLYLFAAAKGITNIIFYEEPKIR